MHITACSLAGTSSTEYVTASPDKLYRPDRREWLRRAAVVSLFVVIVAGACWLGGLAEGLVYMCPVALAACVLMLHSDPAERHLLTLATRHLRWVRIAAAPVVYNLRIRSYAPRGRRLIAMALAERGPPRRLGASSDA